MCTVCGATLGPMPVVDDTAAVAPAAREFAPVRLRPFPDADFARLHDAGREMTELLRGVRASLANMEAAHENLRQTVETAQLAMAALPTRLQDLLRNGSDGGGSSQATATDALDRLPRTVLTEHSALFYRCSLTIERPPELAAASSSSSSLGTTAHQEEPWTIAAIPGEFGHYDRLFCLNAVLRLADPLEGHKVGTNPQGRNGGGGGDAELQRPVIYYFVRGGGVSFVRKAQIAQAAGAVACVIGNHLPSPWPFCMCDSTNEAAATSLTIPTVMVSQAHGEALHRAIRSARDGELSCTLRMEPTLCDDTTSSSSTESCVVCAEVYAAGHTIVTLPGCGHTFHETCALQWLQRHNTCPYCRHSLPLQDEELERRRQQHQNSATDGNNASTQPDFYG
jgi:Ring finger domain/PA domain